MRPLLRPVLFAAVAVSLLAGGTAWAQFDAGTTTSSFAPEDFFIRMQEPSGSTLSDFEVGRFFNKARCECNAHATVYVALSQTGLAKQATVSRTGSLEIWLGAACNDYTTRGTRCVRLFQTTMTAFLHDASGRLYIDTDARTMSSQPNLGTAGIDGGLSGSGFPNTDCTINGDQYTQTIWALVDSNMDGIPETAATQNVLIDLTAPDSPNSDQITLAGGNQALVVTWPSIDSARWFDLVGFQVLCKRGADLQVFADSTFGAGFQTCTNPQGDAGITFDPGFDGGVEALNPMFACSPLLSPTTTSYRVKILQNDIPYGVAVVSVDSSGNASKPDLFYGRPIKTKSFYDVYRNDDDQNPGLSSGGLCALGTGPVSGGTIAGSGGALALVAVVLACRRGRGRRRK